MHSKLSYINKVLNSCHVMITSCHQCIAGWQLVATVFMLFPEEDWKYINWKFRQIFCSITLCEEFWYHSIQFLSYRGCVFPPADHNSGLDQTLCGSHTFCFSGVHLVPNQSVHGKYNLIGGVFSFCHNGGVFSPLQITTQGWTPLSPGCVPSCSSSSGPGSACLDCILFHDYLFLI